MLQISSEQLQQLVEAVRLAATSSAANAAAAEVMKSKGSFANCPTRFYGYRQHDEVEEFITNASTYKEIEGITDADALNSVSLLFHGIASTWWQGIRKEAKNWDDVIRLIREHFSPAKPAYQIYLDIFNEKQADGCAIDVFICEKRALLAQLPEGRHDEEAELDLVYGLLNIKYRKYISRQDVKTFKELLEKGRLIEYNTVEDEEAQKEREAQKDEVHGHRPRRRCTFCNYRGHNAEDCRKRKTNPEA